MPKTAFFKKKYVIAILVLIGVLAVAAYVLIGRFGILPSSLKDITQKKPAVQLKTTYNNPFDKKTQFVNPFEEYKNPFVVNR